MRGRSPAGRAMDPARPPHPPTAGRPWGGGYWILPWYIGMINMVNMVSMVNMVNMGYWVLGIGFQFNVFVSKQHQNINILAFFERAHV